jgi:hypothetical protein
MLSDFFPDGRAPIEPWGRSGLAIYMGAIAKEVMEFLAIWAGRKYNHW